MRRCVVPSRRACGFRGRPECVAQPRAPAGVERRLGCRVPAGAGGGGRPRAGSRGAPWHRACCDNLEALPVPRHPEPRRPRLRPAAAWSRPARTSWRLGCGSSCSSRLGSVRQRLDGGFSPCGALTVWHGRRCAASEARLAFLLRCWCLISKQAPLLVLPCCPRA